jgi:hypothetical protein
MKRFGLGCLLLLAALALAPAPAHAQAQPNTQAGHVIALVVRASDGLIYFFLDGEPTQRPACASKSYYMIANESSETGKRQYELLLSAVQSYFLVEVVGAGTCTRWPDGEDVDYLILYPGSPHY